MSHISEVSIQVKDLNALEAAAVRMGGELVRGKTSYVWFGQWVGDSPMPPGLTKADLGKCDHAIKFPGVKYEVGVVAQADGTFRLQFDFWDRGLREIMGQDGKPLVQAYAVEKAKIEARRMGRSVIRESINADGSVKLVLAGR